MKLGQKQQCFSIALAKLILYADSLGVSIRLGDAWAGGKNGHKKNSNHYIRLAIDLNVFINGSWITSSEDPIWETLHTYWSRIGGARPIKKDMNHFSFEHNGRR